jgi:hypothetical protein
MKATLLRNGELLTGFDVVFDDALARAEIDYFTLHQLTSITIYYSSNKQQLAHFNGYVHLGVGVGGGVVKINLPVPVYYKIARWREISQARNRKVNF